ncbi:MAG: hypothetical protein LBT49_04080 [Prevotellaceae bacterium]|jgi:hypothetical protein|nr:hypothetical protein [Prevotellaceae bacterium]
MKTNAVRPEGGIFITAACSDLSERSVGFPDALATKPSVRLASQTLWRQNRAFGWLPRRSGDKTERSVGFPARVGTAQLTLQPGLITQFNTSALVFPKNVCIFAPLSFCSLDNSCVNFNILFSENRKLT